MSSWILILTITGFNYHPSAISSVNGFTSEKSCMVAADTWVKQGYKVGGSAVFRALCVKA